MGKRDFARFKFKICFGRISHFAQMAGHIVIGSIIGPVNNTSCGRVFTYIFNQVYKADWNEEKTETANVVMEYHIKLYKEIVENLVQRISIGALFVDWKIKLGYLPLF